MKTFLVLVLLAGAIAAGVYFFVFDHEPASETRASITGISARFDGTSEMVLLVDVEVEAVTAMPPVGPHLRVTARCDEASDEAIGDVGLLANASAGDRKTDSFQLFARVPFGALPVRCEITASTTDGTATASACIELGSTRDGGC